MASNIQKSLNRKLIVASLIILLIAAALARTITHVETPSEADIAEQKEIEFLNRVCKKVGDMHDRSNGFISKRTIYECPDGQTHIR